MADEIKGLSQVVTTGDGSVDEARPVDRDEYDAIRSSASPTSSNPFATMVDVLAVVASLSWKNPVKDKDIATPPGSPTLGDRYIVASGGTGDWLGKDDQIAEWNGSSWDFTVPVEGFALWVEDEDKYYAFNGTLWVCLGNTMDHGNLQGLGDDDHTQYHNNTRGDVRYFQQSEHINTSVGAGDAGKPIKLNAGGEVDSSMLPTAGSQLFRFNANDATFPASNPAGAASRNEHPILTFDDSTDENAIFHDSMSRDYAGGNLTVDIDWVAAPSVTTGDVKWDVSFERIAAGGQDIDSDGFAAIQTGTDTTSGTSGVVTRTSITFTQAQADSIVAGDAFRLKITRDTSVGGDMAGDAQVLRVVGRQ